MRASEYFNIEPPRRQGLLEKFAGLFDIERNAGRWLAFGIGGVLAGFALLKCTDA
jgi:hypothetical protein